MKKFIIGGMSCAACSRRVELAVSKVEGVSKCWVNLISNTLTVEGNVQNQSIINAVTKAGYTAFVYDKKQSKNAQNNEIKKVFKRLLASVVFLLLLMYVSMGHTMYSLPLPNFLGGFPLRIAITQLVLSFAVIIINRKFFINGFKGLIKFAPNMDTLVAIGSFSAFAYSCYLVYKIGQSGSYALLHNLYFESAAMILTLITVGKLLEAKSKGKTANALKELSDLSPKTATVLIDEIETVVPCEELKVGDIVVVKAGESVAVDGVVVFGNALIDESALTGESIPCYKGEGDTIKSATLSKSGYVRVRATNVGNDTTIAKIIDMVSDAVSSKAPISRIADKVSGVFVPVVIGLSVITATVWLILGADFFYTLKRAISVLVISCPCALGLATPVAITVGSGIAAKKGILFKTAEALENTGKTNIAVFDKTGTITKGNPEVCQIIAENKKELLSIAASLEQYSLHPLSLAIMKKAKEDNVKIIQACHFKDYTGKGVSALIENKMAYGGNISFIKQFCSISDNVINQCTILSKLGQTPLLFAYNGCFLGIIAVADKIKEDSKEAVNNFNKLGIKTVMLTGDNQITASTVASEVGIQSYKAELLPLDKAEYVKELTLKNKVLMVGDGINDAPALAVANVGAAVANGSDIAASSANIVLINSSLNDAALAVRLSRKVIKTIKQNLFWAFFYNIISIPVAAGVFAKFGLEISPTISAAAMSLSSFCVIANALRLNVNNIGFKNRKKENKTMESIIKVEGMMCPHCEARVKSVLEEIDGVTNATANHKKNRVTLTLEKEVQKELLVKAITDAGYKVIE